MAIVFGASSRLSWLFGIVYKGRKKPTLYLFLVESKEGFQLLNLFIANPFTCLKIIEDSTDLSFSGLYVLIFIVLDLN